MGHKIDKDLIEKFFNKTCTEKEAVEVFLWLGKNYSSAEVALLLKDRWRQSRYLDNLDTNTDELYLSILSEIDKDHSPAKIIKAEVPVKERKRFKGYLSIAASVIIILSSVFAFYFFQNGTPVVKGISEITKTTQPGNKLTTRLPDGTLVTLNSESELRYPQTFSDSNRLVHLSGEAYFEVAKDKEKPFIVRTKTITTTALGTAFNVKAENKSGKIIVSLTEGKVMVNSKEEGHKPKHNFILHPGEELEYNTESREVKLGRFEYKTSIAWKEGLLTFDDADIDELKTKLEKWYGVEITFRNKPNKLWRFTSEYKNENLENVLQGIQYSKNIEYTINEKNVEIFFK